MLKEKTLVLPKIMLTDQKGYIQNRYLGFNIRQIQDIIDYPDIFKLDGAILFVDFSRHSTSLNGICVRNLCRIWL